MRNKDKELRLYDLVRIKSFRVPVDFKPDGLSRRIPRVGDMAAIIEIYLSPPGYELECSDSGGITEWLCAFAPGDIELEKVD